MMPLLAVLVATLSGSPEPQVHPLEVTPEMRAWLREHVSSEGAPAHRWRRLELSLIGYERFVQTPLHTTTAAEAFATRQANCVAFAHLVVALAREANLEAYFVLVEGDTAPSSRRRHLEVAQTHMTAGFTIDGQPMMLDLGGQRSMTGNARRISDLAARAIFLSNLGAEELLAGAPAKASRWLRAAVRQDPGLARVWANLGVAERRCGHPLLAFLAYQRALALSIEPALVTNNLKVLRSYRNPGPPDERKTSNSRIHLAGRLDGQSR